MQKRIWVGLDVHAESISVCRLEGDSSVPQRFTIENRPKLIERAFKKLVGEGEVLCAYEAGACGFEIFRQVTKLGAKCDVVAASLIPQKPGDRVKTDGRDAEKLARMLRAGDLTAVTVPTSEQESGRDLLRAREDFRMERTSVRNRLTKFLLRHGHRFSPGKNWTGKFWKWISEVKLEHEASRITFDHYIDQVKVLDARIAALDKEISKLAQTEPYRARVEKLSCLRGIKELTAMVLLTELYDLKRFPNARSLMAYVGLTVAEHSSGGRVHRQGITKTGNAHVRRALVEAAWSYRRKPRVRSRAEMELVKQSPAVAEVARKATARLCKKYASLVGRGKSPQLAVTAVARELAGFVWAMEVRAG